MISLKPHTGVLPFGADGDGESSLQRTARELQTVD
jgi:hypothetical protein